MKKRLDYIFFAWLVFWIYPKYQRPKYDYMLYSKVLWRYAIAQKILRINGKVPWPVHFTSKIIAPELIQKGVMCDPADTPGVYINADRGIIFGNNIELGPGVKIMSSNHDLNDFSQKTIEKPIIIGDYVWIGANACILPGVQVGNNVIIGAGSVVTKDIPDNSIAVGNPCKVIKTKAPYTIDYKSIVLGNNKPN